jgi:hypothetical protein
MADLGHGDDVDRVVQRPVAAHIQAVPVGVRARCFDRSGAVVVGELGTDTEAADVADLAEHDRCDHGADAMQLDERGARRCDLFGDSLLRRCGLDVDAFDVGEMLAGGAGDDHC